MSVVDEVPVFEDAQVYAEGWQSWSPAGWHGRRDAGERPSTPQEHVMRYRPGVALSAGVVQGEGLLVVRPGSGAPERVYAAVDPAWSVPTIRAEWLPDRILVHSDGPIHVWTAPAITGPQAFETASPGLELAGTRLGKSRASQDDTPAKRVWCSWYRYFGAVTAADIAENVRAIDELTLPVDVIQIDDGWSTGAGDWTRPNPRFGSLPDTIERIHDSGRAAGVWLAPFIVNRGSELARWHPGWITGYAGHNWGDDLVGLDLTSPGVRDYLQSVFSRLHELDVDYLKLDFLYAGALGAPHDEAHTSVSAYRSGLRLIRDMIGDSVYILGCGAPLLPSIGLVDAMRIASDTFHEGEENGSGVLRAQGPVRARSWQDGLLWTIDPDCLIARPSYRLREEWARTVLHAPGTRGFSDRLSDLDPRGLELVHQLLGAAN